MDLTPDQIDQLNSLGIDVQPGKQKTSSFFKGGCPDLSGQVGLKTEKLRSDNLTSKSALQIFPLLSISGLTILSFSGLVLLKNKGSNITSNSSDIRNLPSDISITPTQVPKSIQHYLLTSQQLFTQALQQQNVRVDPSSSPSTTDDQSSTIDLLNQSILAATDAIKEFPQDYRGYQQRGRIYQALIDSQPKLIDQSISDISIAQKLNPSSAEITHTLASLYAKKGDAQKTILYLNQTVALEPTKAQNFYDLAKIQQQAGLLPQALETYNRLITLVTDSTQKVQIESEKSALEKLIAQNPSVRVDPSVDPSSQPTINISPTIDSPTIQALASDSLIIAAPDENKNIQVTNQTDSNSLSGNSTLLSGQKEISISNTLLNSTSQVYITTTKGGKNQNLQVISKSEKSFTVGLDSPISEDIEFKWWIIN